LICAVGGLFCGAGGVCAGADPAFDPKSSAVAIKVTWAWRIAGPLKEGSRFYAAHTSANKRVKFAPNNLSMRLPLHPRRAVACLDARLDVFFEMLAIRIG
jgi:hypothetical protein